MDSDPDLALTPQANATRTPDSLRTRRFMMTTLAGLIYATLVLWMTLGPVPWAATRVAELPFGVVNPATWISLTTWKSGSPIEFAFNVAMFIPIGLAASRLPDVRLQVVLPIAFTLFIEIVQIPLSERISNPRDLIANALGALAGLRLAQHFGRRRTRQDS